MNSTEDGGRDWLLNADGSPLRSVVVVAGRLLRDLRSGESAQQAWDNLEQENLSTAEILTAIDFLFLLGLVRSTGSGELTCI